MPGSQDTRNLGREDWQGPWHEISWYGYGRALRRLSTRRRRCYGRMPVLSTPPESRNDKARPAMGEVQRVG